MCSIFSLTPPSCTGFRKHPSSDVGSYSSLPNGNCSALETDLCSKIMLLNLKKSRLEAQVAFNRTQTKLAEMELHLVEIDMRHELWRKESKARSYAAAKAQTTFRRRVLVKQQVRQRGRPCFRVSTRCNTQVKKCDITDDEVVNENEQISPVIYSAGSESPKQSSDLNQTEDFDNDQSSKKVKLSNNDAQETDNSVSPDHKDRTLEQDAVPVAEPNAQHASQSENTEKLKSINKNTKDKKNNDVDDKHGTRRGEKKSKAAYSNGGVQNNISKTEKQEAEIYNNMSDSNDEANCSTVVRIQLNLIKNVSILINSNVVPKHNLEQARVDMDIDVVSSEGKTQTYSGIEANIHKDVKDTGKETNDHCSIQKETIAICSKDVREKMSQELLDTSGKLLNNRNKLNPLVAASAAGFIYNGRKDSFSNNCRRFL